MGFWVPRWGMRPTTTPDAGDAPSRHGTDGDTHGGDVLLGYGTDIEPVMEMGFWVPRWGMGPKDNPDAGDGPSQYGTDGDTHGGDVFLGHGTTIKSVVEMGFWVPQRGTAYQPRVQPWD